MCAMLAPNDDVGKVWRCVLPAKIDGLARAAAVRPPLPDIYHYAANADAANAVEICRSICRWRAYACIRTPKKQHPSHFVDSHLSCCTALVFFSFLLCFTPPPPLQGAPISYEDRPDCEGAALILWVRAARQLWFLEDFRSLLNV